MRRAVLILTALLLLFSVSGCARQEKTAEFFAMDTYMTIRAYGGGEAVSEAERLIFKLEKKLSVTDPESEISRLNNMGEAELSDEAAELIGEALRICEMTGGALDISVYPAVKAWGFTTGEHRVPKEGELSELLKVVDYRRIKIEGNFVRLGEGMLLDLGAVAKGYAGDTTAALLRDRGVGSALLNLGGNVQCLGGKPDGSAWKIGVQDPKGRGYIGILECRDNAVVTSGGYERYFEEDGATYWHVIDPSTCRPADSGLISVTVVGESGLFCDGLSTALFVMGKEKAAALWRETGGFEAIFVSENGDISVTEGLAESFAPSEGRTVSEVIRRDEN